jgi:LmbE family N-acetylglucosaminyl deacetylase
VFAHPDDESFSTGITASKYSKDGWTIDLCVATHGEKGQSGPYGEISPEEVGAIRTKELEDAAKILGIHEISYLPYRDGLLKEEPPGEMEDLLYKKMVEFAPNIVITFDTTGVSNHPDHIRMCYSTTYAFQKYAADLEETRQFVSDVENRKPDIKKRNFVHHHNFALRQEKFTDIVESDEIPKLYYACMPESVISYLKKKKIFPEESFDKPWVGTPDTKITTVISDPDNTLIKLQALAKHKTQSTNVDGFYEDETNPLISKEFFILRYHGTVEVYMGKNDFMSSEL